LARRTHIRLPFRRLGRRLPPIGDEFVSVEALGSLALLATIAAALLWANAAGDSYDDAWGTNLSIGGGRYAITHDLRRWVNDGLMAVFFFVVGLEIKRELVKGDLRDPRRASLPALAALGGMLVPAAIFLAVNPSAPESDGWGIPMATDLAFAVGVLTLLRSRVPPALRLFLLTLAIVDDFGSILVIALFSPTGISEDWLGGVVLAVASFFGLRALRARHPAVYVIPAVAVWVCVTEAGLHGSLAGATLGLLTPADRFHGRPVIDELEHLLHPWATFAIVPLFALANAGIDVAAGIEDLGSPVALGIVVARVVGKLVGIVVVAEVALRLRLGRLPPGVDRGHVAGVAALAGMGFTVALVVADLAYRGSGLLRTAKAGLFAAALASAALGAILLARRPTVA
jgi:NhaA family Na+:H+ antiporter